MIIAQIIKKKEKKNNFLLIKIESNCFKVNIQFYRQINQKKKKK